MSHGQNADIDMEEHPTHHMQPRPSPIDQLEADQAFRCPSLQRYAHLYRIEELHCITSVVIKG